MREVYANNVSAVNLKKKMPGHVDIPRLRDGQVGAFFWYEAFQGFVSSQLALDSD